MEQEKNQKSPRRHQYWWMPGSIIPALILISSRGVDVLSGLFSNIYIGIMMANLWVIFPALVFLSLMLYNQRYVIHLGLLGIITHVIFVVVYSNITQFGFVPLLGEYIAGFVATVYGSGIAAVGFGLLIGAIQMITESSNDYVKIKLK